MSSENRPKPGEAASGPAPVGHPFGRRASRATGGGEGRLGRWRGVGLAACWVCLAAAGCEKKTDEQITIALERGAAQLRGGRAADAVATLTPVTRRDEAPGATLVAKYTLGHAQRSLADEKVRELTVLYVDVARLTSDIAQIGQSVAIGNTLVAGYRLQDPGPVRERIRERVAEAQGGAGRDVWVDTGAQPLLTLSAARQRLSSLQEQVAARQAQLQSLEDRRRAAIAEADELRSRVDGLTGREAVDAFTVASNARKAISVVSSEIDQAEVELAVLRQQVAVAEGQVAVVQRYIEGLQAQERAVSAAVEQINAQIGGQLAVSRLAVEGGEGGGTSLRAKAAELDALLKTTDTLQSEADTLLNEAVAAYEAAFIEAGRLRAELTTRIGPAGTTSQFDATMLDALRRSVWPTVYRMQKGLALAALGDINAQRAGVLYHLAETVGRVKAAVDAAGLAMPQPLTADFAGRARASLDAAVAAYRKADEELLGAAEGLQGTDAESNQRRQSSTIARMLVLYNWGKLLQMTGSADEAQRRFREAVALRDQLRGEGVALPSLPGELGTTAATTPAGEGN